MRKIWGTWGRRRGRSERIGRSLTCWLCWLRVRVRLTNRSCSRWESIPDTQNLEHSLVNIHIYTVECVLQFTLNYGSWFLSDFMTLKNSVCFCNKIELQQVGNMYMSKEKSTEYEKINNTNLVTCYRHFNTNMRVCRQLYWRRLWFINMVRPPGTRWQTRRNSSSYGPWHRRWSSSGERVGNRERVLSISWWNAMTLFRWISKLLAEV